jgi:hypothetical protein
MLTPLVTGIAAAYFAKWISLNQSLALAGIAAVILIGLWIDYDRDIAKAAEGVRRIEERFNRFAGEDLLQWKPIRVVAGLSESISFGGKIQTETLLVKIDGNKLTIAFEKAFAKKVIDSFVERA